jgi:hypothetical protein
MGYYRVQILIGRVRASVFFTLAILAAFRMALGAELPYVVDNTGKALVPVITAHDHCAWPNLTMHQPKVTTWK